jgi:heme-degrading monooxygenase HmoA
MVYARSTTIQAQTSSIGEGIAHVRDEVMPAIQGIEGYVGLSMLVDRQSGRCIATSAWQSEEAMRASDNQLTPIRARAAEILGGTPEVDEWEIVALHRDHPSRGGASVRATWTQIEPARMDRAIDVFKMASLPAVEELTGFCSASLMVQRTSGRAVVSVTYDNLEAMQQNRDEAAVVRTAQAKEAGMEVLDVGEFELAVAHLRVPEMV